MSATATALRLVLATAAACLLAGASAQAATLTWSKCSGGFDCSDFSVPLDRSTPARGNLSLSVQRLPAASNPQKTAVVALAGGPGQPALPLASVFQSVLKAGLDTRDLLIFDQRGTGSSSPLNCNALSTARTLVSAEQGCASELGTARGFYRTVDTVRDIEDLRIAGGYDRLVLFGVSYGTKVAQEYAATYPARVESLILDSTVKVSGMDPFTRSSLRAISRVLRSACAKNACRRATPSPTADLSAVAKRLNGRTVTASVVSSSGRKTKYRLSQTGLLGLLFAADENPVMRAEIPGSLRAARLGDWAPIMRIAARSFSASASSRTAALSDGVNPALYLSTLCEESNFPWNRRAGAVQRWTEATSAALNVPSGQRAPFSARTMLENGSSGSCVGWPVVGDLPTPPAALAQVPTLILSGEADLRTPLEDAEAIKAAVPQATLVRVPLTGHSVVTSDLSSCSANAIAAFFAGSAVSQCAASDRSYSPTPRPATSFRRVSPASGLKGTPGRAVRLVRDTIRDALRQSIAVAIAKDELPQRVGGLRGGTVSPVRIGDSLTLVFSRYQYVPGVRVSGRFGDEGGGSLTLRGSGVRANLRVSAGGAVSGTVNGRSVKSASASSAFAQATNEPSVLEMLSRARESAALGQ